VTNFIEHIIEPDTLLLVWQAPSSQGRTRRVVGQIKRSGSNVSLRYLSGSEEFSAAKEDGFQGFPAFKIGRETHVNDVLEIFLKRLPPRSRSDFSRYLKNLRLQPDEEISDFALLGYSEAKLPGDGFSVLQTFSDVSPPFEFLSEVAGFRYTDATLESINIGDEASFETEPDNEHDADAIKVIVSGKRIGYVNRVHAPHFANWLENYRVAAEVERINGTEDRPLVYLFVRVRDKESSEAIRRSEQLANSVL